MDGAHSASHVACLAVHLPPDSRTAAANDPDARWTLEAAMEAAIYNLFAAYVWGQSDKRRRGPRPQPVGPSWMTQRGGRRKAEAQAMTADALMRELSKPRREAV